MTEHTPGPWDVDVASRAVGERHIHRTFYELRGGPQIVNGASRECDATARLIASAPDLLDALRALFALVDDGAYIDLTDTESTPITRTLRSAIAKATGDTDA